MWDLECLEEIWNWELGIWNVRNAHGFSLSFFACLPKRDFGASNTQTHSRNGISAQATLKPQQKKDTTNRPPPLALGARSWTPRAGPAIWCLGFGADVSQPATGNAISEGLADGRKAIGRSSDRCGPVSTHFFAFNCSTNKSFHMAITFVVEKRSRTSVARLANCRRRDGSRPAGGHNADLRGRSRSGPRSPRAPRPGAGSPPAPVPPELRPPLDHPCAGLNDRDGPGC